MVKDKILYLQVHFCRLHYHTKLLQMAPQIGQMTPFVLRLSIIEKTKLNKSHIKAESNDLILKW